MNRKEFLNNAGKFCAGSCVCALMGSLNIVNAQHNNSSEAPKTEKPRAEVIMEFAEKWVKRFFDVLDSTLDAETRKKIMMANGKICFQKYLEETGQKIQPITLEQHTLWVNNNVKDGYTRVEGNVIYFRFTSAAETGLPANEGACLCSFVESKPEGLSSTYCLCSVGYVKEWYEQLLGCPVEVELLSSALRGDKWCEFKITVS
ncbi:MAG: hypothetical protein JXA92_04415 [candidate division Zixibacteria bacterium]|nr:hypothetical protein [candidate division Zixibacteria bacterium]